MRIRAGFWMLAALLSLYGCDERARISVHVGGVEAKVELAVTPEARRKGLMGRTKLEPDQGMLMVFPSPAVLKFWMLNTKIPLDLGFFDARRRLLSTVTMWPDGGKQIHTSPQPAVYALEMNADWFGQNGLEPGVELMLPYPIEGR